MVAVLAVACGCVADPGSIGAQNGESGTEDDDVPPVPEGLEESNAGQPGVCVLADGPSVTWLWETGEYNPPLSPDYATAAPTAACEILDVTVTDDQATFSTACDVHGELVEAQQLTVMPSPQSTITAFESGASLVVELWPALLASNGLQGPYGGWFAIRRTEDDSLLPAGANVRGRDDFAAGAVSPLAFDIQPSDCIPLVEDVSCEPEPEWSRTLDVHVELADESTTLVGGGEQTLGGYDVRLGRAEEGDPGGCSVDAGGGVQLSLLVFGS